MTMRQSKFREWLAGKPDDEIVGIAAQGGSCPIAMYLEQQEFHFVSVYRTRWYEYQAEGDERVSHRMPPWASLFVRAVDALEIVDPETGAAKETPITAAQASAALPASEQKR